MQPIDLINKPDIIPIHHNAALLQQDLSDVYNFMR